MLMPLAICGAVFWTRVAGLAERFLLFREFDFGWRVPVLGPEGWLGLVGDDQLNPLQGIIRPIFLLIFATALIAAMVNAARRRRRAAYVAVCLALPALIGYGYLNLRGIQLGTNASYDAYKILAVFYPGLLPAVACWAAWGLKAGNPMRGLVLGAMAVVLAGNLRSAWLFGARFERPPLGVSRELIQLRQLELQSDVPSINVLIADGWSRLWANGHLLRIPHYFETHTYEGRLNTPLRGVWDLVGGVTNIALPAGGSRRLSPHYSLVDTRSPYFLRVRFGGGWHGLEQSFGLSEQWRWTQKDAHLLIQNLQARPLTADLRLKVRSLAVRDLQLWLNGNHWATARVGMAQQDVQIPNLVLPPGESKLEFRSDAGAAPAAGDSRELGSAFYVIGFDLREEAGLPAR
jgi:hypothetical protein